MTIAFSEMSLSEKYFVALYDKLCSFDANLSLDNPTEAVAFDHFFISILLLECPIWARKKRHFV